jgi:hypothetical protein
MLRISLGRINGNRRKSSDLSPYAQGLIIAKHQLGLKPPGTGYQLQIACSKVYSTIKQDAFRNNGIFLPQSGHSRAASEGDKRHVLIKIKRNSLITYSELHNATRIDIPPSTFLHILKESGYGHWRA